MTFPEGLYLDWRQQGSAALCLRESRTQGTPPERWLQEIWAHQRILRDQLTTTEDRKLAVLHPGFRNRESGPDFLNAIIQLGDDAPASGDIEIDLVSGSWKSHGHAGNAAYNNVVLHVIWDPPTAEVKLPTLVLKDRLDAPIEELESWVGGAGELPSDWIEGECCEPLKTLAPEGLRQILLQAAQVRLQTKAFQFRARAKGAGWHQALWEGVFRALGYKHNAWPMQVVAEALPEVRNRPIESGSAREAWEARLLGISGLLPSEPRKGTRARLLWDLWWREREAFAHRILPAAAWRLNGVRPANHPQRRLALAAAWLADPLWESRVEDWYRQLTPETSHTDAGQSLLAALKPEADGFWRRHYTLMAHELPDAPPLLGAGRLNDIAINVILPWFWARADAGGENEARQRLEKLYFDWSPGEDNTLLKLARTRLLGEGELPGRKTAALQQGILQIAHDFCAYSNALCAECRFPGIVAQLK